MYKKEMEKKNDLEKMFNYAKSEGLIQQDNKLNLSEQKMFALRHKSLNNQKNKGI